VSADGAHIDFAARDGRFKPWWKQLAMTIHGWDGAGHVMIGGRSIDAVSDRAARTLRFTIADQPTAVSIDAMRH
jgi:alpha-glucosidase